MNKLTVVYLITLLLGLLFWGLLSAQIIKINENQSVAINALVTKGYQDIRVFPLTRQCWSFRATVEDYEVMRVKYGRVCEGRVEERR